MPLLHSIAAWGACVGYRVIGYMGTWVYGCMGQSLAYSHSSTSFACPTLHSQSTPPRLPHTCHPWQSHVLHHCACPSHCTTAPPHTLHKRAHPTHVTRSYPTSCTTAPTPCMRHSAYTDYTIYTIHKYMLSSMNMYMYIIIQFVYEYVLHHPAHWLAGRFAEAWVAPTLWGGSQR